MEKLILIMTLLLSSFSQVCSSQEKIVEQVDNYLNSDIDTVRYEPFVNNNFDFYHYFYQKGKQAIPFLIDAIDIEEKGLCGFLDIRSSSLFPYYLNYKGQRCAYMIEYIMSNGGKTKIYNHCIIVKKANNKDGFERLSYEDMKIVKKLYEKWWNKYKYKSIEDLRKESVINHIFKGSIYKWI